MKLFLGVCVIVLSAAAVHANSNGGSEACCIDMVPLHEVEAQKSPFASTGYKVAIDKNEIGENDEIKITITGDKPFKGYLLQVRDGDKAVGEFQIPGNDAHSKTINCFTNKQTMATHNNAGEKKSVTVSWKPPKGVKKSLTVYATVAQNGGVFWVKQPTQKVTIH